MKFTSAIAVLLSLSSSALALSIADLPSCSLNCFTAAIQTTSCTLTDTKCQCTTGKDAITASVAPCLQKACSSADVAKTLSVSTAICQQATNSSASISSAGSTATGSSTGTATAQSTSNAAVSAKKAFEIMGAGIIVAAGMMAL